MTHQDISDGVSCSLCGAKIPAQLSLMGTPVKSIVVCARCRPRDGSILCVDPATHNYVVLTEEEARKHLPASLLPLWWLCDYHPSKVPG